MAVDDAADRAAADVAFKPNCLGIQTSINDTLLTPNVVLKCKPKTNLWLNHCALVGLPTRNNGCLPLGFADEGCSLARAFCLAGEQQRLALRIYRALRLINIEATQRPQNQSGVTWCTDLTVHSPRLAFRRNEGICLKLSWKLRAGP